MLNNIVIATDASKASDQIINWIEPLRRVGSRQAVLVHVFNLRNDGGGYETLKRSVTPQLEQQQQRLREAGFKVKIEIPLGFSVYEINRVAGKYHCSLVVAGSQGESPAAEAMAGSSTHAMLQTVKLPTLLIRQEIIQGNDGWHCGTDGQDLFSHILHPTDFSDIASTI